MEIKSAQFSVSSQRVDQCPKDTKAEYAFIGRSNVGKSSLINMLTNHKGLAKTSATPGKTLLINHFFIRSTVDAPSAQAQASSKKDGEDFWYLVDLPGYGYAKRSKTERDRLRQMIEGYILQREQLVNVFLLIDIRLEPQQIDLDFIEWLGTSGIPFSLVFTKADKLSVGRAAANVESYKQKLLETWEELPPVFVTSSSKKQGRQELLDYIGQLNQL